MISSKKRTSKKSGKSQKGRSRPSNAMPEWDPTISDLSGLKLSKEEQAKRHAAFLSKNRVQLSNSTNSSEGHRAREGSSNPVWQDFLDYGTVARGLQATQSQSQSQSQSHSHPAHETPPARDQTEIQHQPDEAAEHEEAAAPAGERSEAAHQLPSPEVRSTPGEAAPDPESKPQAWTPSKPEPISPVAGRHRANAAITAAPARQSNPSSPLMQAGIGSQSLDKSARLQARSDSNLLLHSPHERGQPRQSSGVTSSPHQNPDSKPTELPRAMHQADPSAASGSSEAGQSASHKAEELETKLSELTRRLSVAEQAAGVSSEIQSQLLQLKEDKAALQADLKQFMQHTSSMLTTIQAQMSRLMGCAPPTSAFPSAEHSYASAAVGQSDRRQGQGQLGAGHPETALPLQPQAQGSAEPNSPVGLAQARSSISDWRLESHGNQPSPLARHEIFQNAAPSKQLLPRATHSRAQAGQSGSWMDELCMGQDSRSTKGAVDFSPHDAHLAGSVYEDEAALPSFAEMATAQGSLEGAQQSGVCKLPSNRQSAAAHAPGSSLKHADELEPSPLPQRLADMYRDSGLGREALREIPMPQLRQKGFPHVPTPKVGSYNGSAALRLKPMATGLPPMQATINVHDSLALSTWAAAGRHRPSA